MAVSPLFDLSCPASAKPVSYIFSLFLSFTLSPLFVLLLYNLSIAWSMLQYILPVDHWRRGCPCMNTVHLPVHTLAWAAKPSGWSARANGDAKSLISSLFSTKTLGGISNGVSTGTSLITSDDDGKWSISCKHMLTGHSASKRYTSNTPTHDGHRSYS
jgi:hypothetical protein